ECAVRTKGRLVRSGLGPLSFDGSQPTFPVDEGLNSHAIGSPAGRHANGNTRETGFSDTESGWDLEAFDRISSKHGDIVLVAPVYRHGRRRCPRYRTAWERMHADVPEWRDPSLAKTLIAFIRRSAEQWPQNGVWKPLHQFKKRAAIKGLQTPGK